MPSLPKKPEEIALDKEKIFARLSFSRFMSKSLGVKLLVILIVLLIGATAYLYRQNLDLKNGSQDASKEEIASLVAQVSRLMDLPQGETPTVATVVDPDKLRAQPFFVNAQKGDKVLIYTLAHKAILYDPSRDKIVEVAPINVGSNLNPQQ